MPFIVGLITGLMFIGFMFTPWSLPIGMGLLFFGFFGWFWSNSLEHRPPYVELDDNPIYDEPTEFNAVEAACMTNEDFIGRKTLDVSRLPSTMFDDKANLWWGNNWGLAIETTVFGILVALYFSVRMSISQWLPPRTTPGMPVLLNPLPDLTFPTIVL